MRLNGDTKVLSAESQKTTLVNTPCHKKEDQESLDN